MIQYIADAFTDTLFAGNLEIPPQSDPLVPVKS